MSFRKTKYPKRFTPVTVIVPDPDPDPGPDPDPDPPPPPPPPPGGPTLLQAPVITGLPQTDADLTFDVGLWANATDIEIEVLQKEPNATVLARQSVSAGSLGNVPTIDGASLTLRVWASNASGTTLATSAAFGPFTSTGNRLIRALAFTPRAGFNPTPGRSLITWYALGPDSLSVPYTPERGYGFVGSGLSTSTFTLLNKGDTRLGARNGQNTSPSGMGVRVDLPAPGLYRIYGAFSAASTITPRLQVRDGGASNSPALFTVNTVSPVSVTGAQIMDMAGNVTNYATWNAASIYGGQFREVNVASSALWFGRPDTAGALQLNCFAIERVISG